MKHADTQLNLLLEFFQDGRCQSSVSPGPLKNVHMFFSMPSKYTGYLDNAHILSCMYLKYIEYLALSKNICCLLSGAEVQILLPTASCLLELPRKTYNKELDRRRPSSQREAKEHSCLQYWVLVLLSWWVPPRGRCGITGYRHPSGAPAEGLGSLFKGPDVAVGLTRC